MKCKSWLRGGITLLSGLWAESVLIDLVRAFVVSGENSESNFTLLSLLICNPGALIQFFPAVKYCEHLSSGKHNSFCLWLTNWSITLVLLYYRISSRTRDNNWTTHVKISGLIKDWRDRPNSCNPHRPSNYVDAVVIRRSVPYS